MNKEYYNEQKASYIKDKLSLTSIDKVYHPLIIEIMLRRQFEYKLDDDIFNRDLNTFLDNVKTITIEDIEEEKPGIVGGFSASNRRIRLSPELFKKDKIDFEKIFEVLAHETVHAMRFGRVENRRKRDRVFQSDSKNKLKPIGEVFTECEADGLVYTRENVHVNKGIALKDTNGYPHLTPFIDIIAATFRSYKKRIVK